jgi:hypothetical protein
VVPTIAGAIEAGSGEAGLRICAIRAFTPPWAALAGFSYNQTIRRPKNGRE